MRADEELLDNRASSLDVCCVRKVLLCTPNASCPQGSALIIANIEICDELALVIQGFKPSLQHASTSSNHHHISWLLSAGRRSPHAPRTVPRLLMPQVACWPSLEMSDASIGAEGGCNLTNMSTHSRHD